MARKKDLIDPAFADAFHKATAVEQIRRSDQRRAQQEHKKATDAAAARARKEAEQKAAAAKTFENKITQEVFPSLQKLVHNVFGDDGCLAAHITTHRDSGETRLELTQRSYAPSPHYGNDYWMTATVKGDALHVQHWGRAIDPQMRGYERTVTLDELHTRVAHIITDYASDAELKKLQKLVRKPKPKATAAEKPQAPEKKPEGIQISRPLQLKPPSSGGPA